MSLFLSITILMFLFVIAIAVYNLHKSFIEYVVSLKKLIEGETSTTLSSVHANFDTLFGQNEANFDTLFGQNEANFGTLSEAIRDISKPKAKKSPKKLAKPKKKRVQSEAQKRLASERMKARWAGKRAQGSTQVEFEAAVLPVPSNTGL